MGGNNDDLSTTRVLIPLQCKEFVVKEPSLLNNCDYPEVDYDNGATNLYQQIENKDWDKVITRAQFAPIEAKTWVCRREHNNSNKIRWRLLPIHATCIFRSPLSVIEALITAFPDGPKMRDDQSMLPIHLACRNGASKGVVLTLLKAFPDSINFKDRKSRTPYDFADSSHSQNREAVMFALNRFKGNYDSNSISDDHNDLVTTSSSYIYLTNNKEVDYDHRTILFRLILKKDWDGVVQRSKLFPDEALTWIVTKGFNGSLRFLPLHKACVLQPPDNVIEALLEAFPDGSICKDQDGWLPIHCACFYGASEGVVNILLKVNQKSLMIKDDDGRLPLHYACIKGATVGIISALIESNSKSSTIKDFEGKLPIHHASLKCAPQSTIDILLKSYPRGIQIRDDFGRLPLHLACRKNTSERTIRTILNIHSNGAKVKDDQDKLPIHYACQNFSSNSVVFALLETYPESINIKNDYGKTPLEELVERNDPKLDSIIETMKKIKCGQDEIKNRKDDFKNHNIGIHNKLIKLSNRVKHLENTMNEITRIGIEVKSKNLSTTEKEAITAINKIVDILSHLHHFQKKNEFDVDLEKNVN